MAGEEGQGFCAEVLAWASREPSAMHSQLARYLHTRVVRRCARFLAEQTSAPETAPGARTLGQYARAVQHLAANRGAAALPLLLDVLAHAR
jgi:hypothetical protein